MTESAPVETSIRESSTPEPSTIAVITGANSGIGRTAAVDLAARGWTIYGTMRSLDKGERLSALAADAGVEDRVHQIVCDVTDTESVNRAVAEVTADAGRIDVLVNNAGVGGNGVTEEVPVERYAEIMDVNLYGIVRCVQAVAPQMRERGAGCIINVGSVAGVIAAVGQAPYVASKWAVEGLTESLAQEMAAFGVRVALVQPGLIRTAILAKNTDAPNSSGAYDRAYRRLFWFYQAGLANPGHPSEVAALIHEIVTTDEPRLRWTCGWGGPELTTSKPNVSDEDWVALGTIEDDDEYVARFTELFGLDIPVAGT